MQKQVVRGLGVLRQVRDVVPSKSLNHFFTVIIQSPFDYFSSVWDICDNGHQEKLQKLQNRSTMIITRSGCEIRSTDLLHKLLKNVRWRVYVYVYAGIYAFYYV